VPIGQYASVASSVETRLHELGLTLPARPQLPLGVTIPFEWVRVREKRAFVSGHGPLALDGAPAGPFGKVPSEVPLEAATVPLNLPLIVSAEVGLA
jgi:hypothetical protein